MLGALQIKEAIFAQQYKENTPELGRNKQELRKVGNTGNTGNLGNMGNTGSMGNTGNTGSTGNMLLIHQRFSPGTPKATVTTATTKKKWCN